MAQAKDLTAAIEAVTQACCLCSGVQQHISAIDTVEKADRSPVTIADMGSQALITQALLNAFPGDPIVGEEDADDE